MLWEKKQVFQLKGGEAKQKNLHLVKRVYNLGIRNINTRCDSLLSSYLG